MDRSIAVARLSKGLPAVKTAPHGERRTVWNGPKRGFGGSGEGPRRVRERAVMVSALGVAVVGFGWMGRMHTQAYARVPHHFPQLPLRPELITVVEEVPGRAEEAARQFGFASTARDWREVVADPRIQAPALRRRGHPARRHPGRRRARRHRAGRDEPLRRVGAWGGPLSPWTGPVRAPEVPGSRPWPGAGPRRQLQAPVAGVNCARGAGSRRSSARPGRHGCRTRPRARCRRTPCAAW